MTSPGHGREKHLGFFPWDFLLGVLESDPSTFGDMGLFGL